MAKKDTRFKKGQSGNPSGRRKEPEEFKVVKASDTFTVAAVLHEVIHLSVAELLDRTDEKNLENLKRSGLEFSVARIMLKAISKGDQKALDFILNRLIGRVSVEVVSNDAIPMEGGAKDKTVFILPSNGREVGDQDDD